MENLVSGIISFSLKNKFFTFFITAALVIAGIWSYLKTPLEAFPDVTNTQIIIVTQWNGRSAEEVERSVSLGRLDQLPRCGCVDDRHGDDGRHHDIG